MIRLRHVLTQETNFPFNGLRKTAGPFTVNGPAPLRCIRAGLWVIGNTCKACVPPHTNEYCRRLTYCRRFHCCLLLLAMRMNATPALPEASAACSERPARSPTCSQCRARRSIKTSTVTGLRLKKYPASFSTAKTSRGRLSVLFLLLLKRRIREVHSLPKEMKLTSTNAD